jgi:hypothetical protein
MKTMEVKSDNAVLPMPAQSAPARAWRSKALMLATAVVACAPHAQAQEASDLAKKLANPISSLISVPFQLNYDSNIGPADDEDRPVRCIHDPDT